MADRIIQISDRFWNIRGSFKIGFIEAGTQASLVRRANGKLVLLDSYTLSGAVEREVAALSNDGRDLEAILNLHPFHTIHVRRVHERFPDAKLYGTARHHAKAPELPWEPEHTEDPSLHAMFADDFDFSVPRGVDFISKNENVHFSSVLAFHRASQTIHVDDTLVYTRLPKPARLLGRSDLTMFHPTLAKALERRAGAAADFRAWADEMATAWRDADNLCAAHTGALTAERNHGDSIAARIRKALAKVEPKLRAHERKYG